MSQGCRPTSGPKFSVEELRVRIERAKQKRRMELSIGAVCELRNGLGKM